MAIIITVAALKGGVGKSTVTLNLASCFHKAGHKTLIIDTDPQATCRTWSNKAAEQEIDGPPVVGVEGKTLRKDLASLSAGFDVVLIDTPPRMAVETRAAMLVSNLVVLPTIPGAADVWALQETVDVFKDAQSIRDDLKAAIVINRKDRTTLSKLTLDAVEAMGIARLKTSLGSRVVFGEATLSGTGVVYYAPASQAAKEVESVLSELLEMLKGE
jgi:chromosome partitioning protein